MARRPELEGFPGLRHARAGTVRRSPAVCHLWLVSYRPAIQSPETILCILECEMLYWSASSDKRRLAGTWPDDLKTLENRPPHATARTPIERRAYHLLVIRPALRFPAHLEQEATSARVGCVLYHRRPSSRAPPHGRKQVSSRPDLQIPPHPRPLLQTPEIGMSRFRAT